MSLVFKRIPLYSFCLLLTMSLLSACSHTYPEERLVQDLRALCLREYGIKDVDVKIVGKTIGVHLPLKQLFTTDFSKLLEQGDAPVQSLESLMQFSPDAMERVENVLFVTSRVILSTDKKLDFYILTATDTEFTGVQLVLIGYLHDLRRVRFWDISRDEYRKRIANDLRINRGVLWKKTVTNLFKDMETKPTHDIVDTYFLPDASAEEISPLFYSEILELAYKKDIRYEILEIKSTSLKDDEIVVYAKVRSTFRPAMEYVNYDFLVPPGYEAEYIFILEHAQGKYKIQRVIPFHFIDENEKMERVEFPEELGLYRNIDTWLEDFTVEEVFLPEFLADQLTRRVNHLLMEDEKISGLFSQARIEFTHVKAGEAEQPQAEIESEIAEKDSDHFRLMVLFSPRNSTESASLALQDIFEREDVRYMLDKALQEFVEVIRGYRFNDFEYLDIFSPAESQVLVLGRQQLELYRQRKLPLVDLFNAAYRAL